MFLANEDEDLNNEKARLMRKCVVLLADIDRRQPGGRGRHHLEAKLRSLLERINKGVLFVGEISQNTVNI